MRRPFISLMQGGRDLIPVWGPLMESLVITDEKGMESDKLTVILDNRDGQCAFPEPGAMVSVSGGYVGEGGRVTGQFEVDQVDFEGWPEKITVYATTVSAKKATKERKTEAHKKEDTPTVGDLAKKIAKRNGWSPRIAPEIAKIPLEYEGQAGEFDAQFLTRIVRRFGGIAAVKQGSLVVTKAGAGQSVSGRPLTPIRVAPGLNLISYRASFKKRDDHDKAQAHTFDRKKVKRIDVDAGQGAITYRLREAFKSEAEAKKAAEAKLSDLKRGTGSATFEIEGDPDAAAECPVLPSGVPTKLAQRWNAIRVEHRFQDDKYVTSLECELPGQESASGGSSASDSD
ncbi:hypothetical protein [Methylobacterium hispanicum]|uniref:phage late control D family protein n=1 Tax=Methylobacterium hispanicum TaxID=270350 RepID=UPI002F32CBBD